MPDAGPSTSAKGKAPAGKAAKVGADAGTDGKKRFEVKKVRPDSVTVVWHPLSSGSGTQ